MPVILQYTLTAQRHKQCLFVIEDDHGVARRLWQLIDRVVQQISVQEDDGSDPDVAPLDINVNYILDT